MSGYLVFWGSELVGVRSMYYMLLQVTTAYSFFHTHLFYKSLPYLFHRPRYLGYIISMQVSRSTGNLARVDVSNLDVLTVVY